MKKTIAALTAFVMLTTALAGCSNNSDSDSETVAPATEPITTTAEAAVSTAEETEETESTETETEAMTDQELTEKLNGISQYISERFSKAILNRLSDDGGAKVGIDLERNPSVLIRVKEASDIPNAALELCGLYREVLAEYGFTKGILSISYFEKDDNNRMIDGTMIAWRSSDGVTGTLVDPTTGKKVEDCDTDKLYEYFGDKVKPFTAEEAADLIKMKLNKNAEGLVYDDRLALLVSTAGGSIAVTVRTYEEFLIPAAAEYAYEIVIPIAERSELPFGRLNATVYDNDENGGIVQETMVNWMTVDGETGTFNSKIEVIGDQPMTLEELYEKYGEYDELIQKAKSGERVIRP